MANSTASWAQPIPYETEGKTVAELQDDLREYNDRCTSFDILISRLQERQRQLRLIVYRITAALGKVGELSSGEATAFKALETLPLPEDA